MGKKGRKTRWRKLPIPIGNGERKPIYYRGGQQQQRDDEEAKASGVSGASAQQPSRITFNEDEYTKITTPRQDMLFKKGYLGRKKATTPTVSQQDTTDAQSADSVESEQYCCEEQMPPYMYATPTGYIDHTGIFYVSNYEVYDPYTGGVAMVVGPAPQFPGHHPVLAALPCAPVPLQSVEWFPPPLPTHQYNSRKKSSNSVDSQTWSGQSSETTCPPGSPQDPAEQCETLQPYVYPGYMYGPPVYNINGVNVQGVVPAAAQPSMDQSKRRKKRRRRRRGGVTDEGSESSCEEVCSLEAVGSSSSSSKTNSDSGIATDPCGASGGQGSLSSLSNDEAEKDSKSINCEEESLTLNKKDKLSEGEEKDADPVKQDDDSTVETCASPSEPTEPSIDLVEPSDEAVESVAKETTETVHLTPQHEIVNTEEQTIEPVLETSVESEETTEDFQEASLLTTEKSKESDVIFQDEETTAEITEALSDDDFEDKENIVSSDESTLPCTADDRSITESHPEEELMGRLSANSTELRIENEIEDAEEEKLTTGFNDLSMYDLGHLELEPIPDTPPVAPPRRKKSAKVAEKLATGLAEEIVTDAISCAAEQRWPITSAVTKWLEDSEDEIEEAEEATGQKNGEGNPFLAPSHSGSRTRVASNEWSNSRVRQMCDPISSVNKYYRLAMPMKTGPGPFPCGICCIIQ